MAANFAATVEKPGTTRRSASSPKPTSAKEFAGLATSQATHQHSAPQRPTCGSSRKKETRSRRHLCYQRRSRSGPHSVGPSAIAGRLLNWTTRLRLWPKTMTRATMMRKMVVTKAITMMNAENVGMRRVLLSIHRNRRYVAAGDAKTETNHVGSR